MTTHYLDTSVAVYALLGHPAGVEWFEHAAATGPVVSSRLLKTELTRVLRRDGSQISSREYVLDRISIAPLDEATLSIAESITPHVKTLDAIHLATCLGLGGDAVMVSHDAQVLRVAGELGLRTLDPLVV